MLPRRPDPELILDDSAARLNPPPCANMAELTIAIISIVVVLLDRPRAMISWLTLLQTATRLNEEWGWAKAWAYVSQVLEEKVEMREDFGPWDNNIGWQILLGERIPDFRA